jgi:hypothetical protein
MSWADSGDIKTIFVEGVIPLVVGISLCFVSALYCLGIIKFRCVFSCIDDQVAPAVMLPAEQQEGTPMTLAAAEKAYGPVACQAQLYGMEPTERQQVLESVLTPFCSTHQRQPLLQKVVMTDNLTEATNNERNMNNDSSENSGGNSGLDTSCACAICLREYGTYVWGEGSSCLEMDYCEL